MAQPNAGANDPGRSGPRKTCVQGRSDVRSPSAFMLAFAIAAAVVLAGNVALTQGSAPTNSAPNPYRTVANWGKLPEGRSWGSTSAVAIDPDGASVWVAERCGE